MNHHDINITLTPGHNEDPTRSRTFTVSFFNTEIHTTVTSTPAVARQWVHSLRRTHLRWYSLSRYSPVIGLGVQWKPSSTSAATLQLSIDKKCLIFQLSHSPAIPATLRDLLLDDRVTFFGVHNGRDRSLLQGSHHELDVNNLVDLAEEENGHYLNWSMEDMAEDVLGFSGVHKPRKVMLSDWDQYCLSNDQLQYACVDAYVSLRLARAYGYHRLDDDDDDYDDHDDDDNDHTDDDYDDVYDRNIGSDDDGYDADDDRR